MTKKSAGRIERDAQKKATEKILKDPDSNLIKWEDLENIFVENSNMIITANKEIANVYKIPGVIINVPDKKATADHIRGLAKDIKFFGDELAKIHSDHQGKTGTVKDSDETIAAIKIYEGYVNWQQEYQSVILPTITFLAEQAGMAVEEIGKASNALDVNVITDVEVKTKTIDDNQAPVVTPTELQ